MSKKKETVPEYQKRIARLGGQATLVKYGIEHLRKIGKLGGRPRKNKEKENGLN